MADTKVNDLPDLDLGNTAIRYLRLLTKVHNRQLREGHHGDRDPIFNAIYRYEKFWLPLCAENTEDANLKPPWDIYYVWCLHILTSSKYRDYCRSKYNCVIGHDFMEDPRDEDVARERTKEIWEDRFPEEKFEGNVKVLGSIPESESELNKVIVKSEQKQATFFYQVSLSHFSDMKFVADAVNRYQKLHVLKREHPGVELCSTHDLEVIRQAHLLSPKKYEADLLQIFGEVVEFTAMEQAFNEVATYDLEEKTAIETTRRLWTVKYKTNYDVAGIKHRGLSEEGRFRKATQIHLKQSEPEAIMLSLNQIKISDLWSRDQKIVIEGRRLRKTTYTYDILFRISGKSGETLSTKAHRMPFNLRENRGVELHTFGIKGSMCFKREEHVATTFFDPRKLYEEGEKMVNKELLVEVPRVSYGDPTVSFLCGIEVVEKAKPHMFTLYREAFVPGPIPADLKPFIKLSSWSDVDTFDMDTFYSARHSVRTPGGWGSNFTCHVVSCRDLDLGAVLMYEDGTELVTAAHTIREDQLPLPDQVSPSYQLSLDRISGQHAMLIRNHHGDWGLCIVKKHPELDGGVAIVFENRQKHYVRDVTFTFEQSTTLRMDDNMSVDLYTGKVTLAADCAEAAEYVTLAYVIGVLYVFTSGHQAPQVTSAQGLRENDVTPTSQTVGGTASSKIKSKAKSTKYDVTSRHLSARLTSAVTLSNLKMRRKKKTLVCTMLLACGLKANMLVEEDLTRMSFHSEVSLLSRSASDHELAVSHGMDDIHRHSFYTQVQEDSRELNATRQIHNGFLMPAVSHDQFSFRKADDGQPQDKMAESEEKAPTPMKKVSVVLRADVTDVNKNVRMIPRDVSWVNLNQDTDHSYDTADFSSQRKHNSAVSDPPLTVRDSADSTPLTAYGEADSDPLTMTVNLEDRAQHLVNQVMAEAMVQIENPSSGFASVFISEDDDIPPDYDNDEPEIHEEKEVERMNTRL